MGMRAVEVHYFRVPRDQWELVLLRAGQFGVDVISTYIPWMVHEPVEGSFDLTGETDERRDLAGFIRLVREFGFGFLAKPGPFVDAELLGGGVPPWLARARPELIARRFNGDPFLHSDSHDPRCSVRHPEYVSSVGRWFDAVVPLLTPLQDDGSLVAVQVDNECPGDGFWSYEMEPPSPNRLDYNDPLLPQGLVREWPTPPPGTLEELAPFVELERLADEQMTGAVATFGSMLRERGITAPLFHDMCCGRWEIGPMVADMGLLAQATGWLGSNVYAEDVRDPFYVEGWYRYSFEEYVHFCHWRPRLMRSLAPDRPVFTPEISATGDLYLHAPLMGGTEAFCVYMLHQVPNDPPDVGSYPAWAMEAPLRADGTLTPKFWNGKTLFTWLAACGEALDRSTLPADVCLLYDREPERAASWAEIDGAGWPDGDPFGEQVRAMNTGRRSQEQAQELVRRQIEFDVVDVRFPPSPDWRDRYRDVLAPGDEVPDDPDLRHAWTDADGVDAIVRVGDGEVFLTLLNRTQERREGTASWRGGGSIGFAMDGPALCAAHVRNGTVVSAILAGDARIGGWAFTGRLGAACAFGDTLVLTAPVPGMFTVPVGGRSLTRLTANGLLQPWDHVAGDAVGYEANALVPEMSRIAYRTVDGWGDTDCLFVGEPVDDYLGLFRTYERLMAERVGPAPRDWETVQWEFAQARSHGELDRADTLERELRLLRLASLTSGELED